MVRCSPDPRSGCANAWCGARPIDDRAALLPDLGLFPALQPVAAALHGRDELRQVHLEGVEDVVRVVLGAQPDLALAGAGVLDDLVGLALGLLHDLLLGDQAGLLVARLLDDPLGLALRLGEHLLALLDDPARLLDLLRDRRAHLVEDVVDLFLVNAHLVRERHGLRVVNRVVELVDKDENVHWRFLGLGGSSVLYRFNSSCSRAATRSGTSPLMSPPNIASSLIPLELRKLYSGAAMK